jgi:hypothetical protein
MHLGIVLPTNWDVSRTSGGHTRALAPNTVRGNVMIEIMPIIERPENVSAWRDEVIARAIPNGCESRVADRAEMISAVGWPLNVFDVEILRDGAVIECQLHVFYFVLEYAAQVIARVGVPEAYPELRGELLRVTASGAPLWSADGEVVAMSQLWQDVETRPAPEVKPTAPPK